MDANVDVALARAANIVRQSHSLIAFTGAGISRESGLPTFRGDGGLWEQIDPSALEISRFYESPLTSWELIRKLFYASSGSSAPRALPNAAHRILAEWEAAGTLSFLVTQNIDGLHRAAGSRRLAEFHGSVDELVCTRCGQRVAVTAAALDAGLLETLPPRCRRAGDSGSRCDGLLKPGFVFFGEAIPREAFAAAFEAASRADVCLVIGSTGVVHPAAELPMRVLHAGGSIIEIDPGRTEFSPLAAAHIGLGASEAMTRLDALVGKSS